MPSRPSSVNLYGRTRGTLKSQELKKRLLLAVDALFI